MRASVIVSAVVAVFAVGPSSAQEERYSLERTDTGYVRMDRQTGEMSICTETSGDLVCRKASDERDGGDDLGEIRRLRQRIDALETRLAALEAAPPKDELPSEETVEQTLSIMERFFRRFVGIMQDIEKDQPPAPPAAPPQKT